MTKSGFAIEKHDGRRRNRCIGDVKALAGGGERVAGCGVARFQFDSPDQFALSIRKDPASLN